MILRLKYPDLLATTIVFDHLHHLKKTERQTISPQIWLRAFQDSTGSQEKGSPRRCTQLSHYHPPFQSHFSGRPLPWEPLSGIFTQ